MDPAESAVISYASEDAESIESALPLWRADARPGTSANADAGSGADSSARYRALCKFHV
jgi:hypothetical protein